MSGAPFMHTSAELSAPKRAQPEGGTGSVWESWMYQAHPDSRNQRQALLAPRCPKLPFKQK